ncbi:MAG TPA: glycoside hydrolase family 15 protein, partial [Cystobacter sp.]
MSWPIEDYALIGDTQTAALVARDGSIDWLCLPRFDSGACFAALLGHPEHGRWKLAPAGHTVPRVKRRYREDSLVLETEFTTPEGVVRVVDCMPPRDRTPDVVRVVEGVRGRVSMHMQLVIRFDYGSVVPWVTRGAGEWRAVAGPDALSLYTPVAVYGHHLTTVADFTISEGQRIPFVLRWHPSHEPAPPPLDGLEALADTEDWWKEWFSHCTYRGAWSEAVRTSLMTLKALTYAPTGGIVAAATTSLPERLGGQRNWDYRFCWLRDAFFVVRALNSISEVVTMEEYLRWLNNVVVRSGGGHIQPLYGIGQEQDLPESILEHLPGYRGMGPVRVGNQAAEHFQHDVYGNIILGAAQAFHDHRLLRRAGRTEFASLEAVGE